MRIYGDCGVTVQNPRTVVGPRPPPSPVPLRLVSPGKKQPLVTLSQWALKACSENVITPKFGTTGRMADDPQSNCHHDFTAISLVVKVLVGHVEETLIVQYESSAPQMM